MGKHDRAKQEKKLRNLVHAERHKMSRCKACGNKTTKTGRCASCGNWL